jgi:transposase
MGEPAQASASKPEEPATLAVIPSVLTKPISRYQKKQHHNRERRLASYQAVMEQISKGATQREVAQSCGLGIRTIRRWIRARGFPERKIGDRKSTVDEYSEYLEQRWNEGCHNATQLWPELRARGFAGQAPIVRTWVRRRYGSRKFRSEQQPSFHSPLRASPRQTAWTLLKEPEDARSYPEELCRRSSEIATCASMAREFVRIIRQRDRVAWKKWKEDAKTSLLASFAKHLRQDEAALMAALQHPWRNGPVEGHVHLPKLTNAPCMAAPNSICFDFASSMPNRGIYLTPPTPICRLRGHGRGFSADFAGAGKAL